MDDEVLYDVVAVRGLPNGGTVKSLIAGPFDEVDARYHRKRLKAISPEQDYVVVLHHVCAKCEYLGQVAKPAEDAREMEAAIRDAWDSANVALQAAISSGDMDLIAQAELRAKTLEIDAQIRADDTAKAIRAAHLATESTELFHTCTRYYNEAPAV